MEPKHHNQSRNYVQETKIYINICNKTFILLKHTWEFGDEMWPRRL